VPYGALLSAPCQGESGGDGVESYSALLMTTAELSGNVTTGKAHVSACAGWAGVMRSVKAYDAAR
jgi:hypothetical protein